MITKNTWSVVNQHLIRDILIFFLLLFMVMTVLQQANPLMSNLQRDSGSFIYVASSFIKGGLPYIMAWENKPPGIFFLDAFGLWIGKGTRWGIWIMEFLFLLVSSMSGYVFLARNFGMTAALIGSGVWLFGLNLILGGGNFTEEYSLLFSFTALFLWTLFYKDERNFWCDAGIGICTGLGILFRPNNAGAQVSIIICIVILHVLNKNYSMIIRRLLLIGLMAAAPVFISSLYFYWNGAFNEFLDASLLYNLSYTLGKADPLNSLLSGAASLGFAFGIGVIGYFAAVNHFLTYRFKDTFDPVLLWVMIDGVVEVLLSSLSGRSYQHYFICWLPVVAISSAFLVYTLFSRVFVILDSRSVATLICVFLIFLPLTPGVVFSYYSSLSHLVYNRNQGIQKNDPVAEYVNAQTRSGDLVLVWGFQAGINYLSNRNSPTPYIYYPLFVPSKITDRFGEKYYHTIQATPPILIVDASYYSPDEIIPLNEKNPIEWSEEHSIYPNPYLTEVMTFIRQNYKLSDVINGVSIYKFTTQQQ